MKKRVLVIGLILCLAFVLVGCGENDSVDQAAEVVTGKQAIETGQAATESLAKSKCIELFKQKYQAGEDMSSGPCLSGEIVEDWACDIVHDPREDVDDLPANQCQTYIDGEVSHYV